MKQPIKLLATKRMVYNTRRLQAGEVFEANDRYAHILIATGRATAAPAAAASPPPAPPRPQQPPPQQEVHPPDHPDIEELRKKARSIGVIVDMRWGVRTLQAEIEKHGTA